MLYLMKQIIIIINLNKVSFFLDFGKPNNCADEHFEGNNTKSLSLFVIKLIFQ